MWASVQAFVCQCGQFEECMRRFSSAICGCSGLTRINRAGPVPHRSYSPPLNIGHSTATTTRVEGISDDPWLWMERCFHHFRTITRTDGVQPLCSAGKSVASVLAKLASSQVHVYINIYSSRSRVKQELTEQAQHCTGGRGRVGLMGRGKQWCY